MSTMLGFRYSHPHRFPRLLPIVIFCALSVFYFAVTLVLASRKLLWDDELFTMYIVKASGPEGIWGALTKGVDQHPPPFYWVTNAIFDAFGSTHVSFRLPAAIGFWVMSLCIFWFVKRRTCGAYGLLAACVPALCVHYYAYEARGYGLVLGACGIALVLWQIAGNVDEPLWVWLGLALSLSLAVCFHYYAIFITVPLALGEVVRTLLRRRIEWRTWLAFCSPALPLVLFLPVIRGARSLSGSFWAKPDWTQIADFFPALLAGMLAPMALAIIGLAVFLNFRPSLGSDMPAKTTAIPMDEVMAAGTLALLPGLILAVAIFFTNAYHVRYALWSVVGLSILFGFVSHRIFHGSVRVATAITALCLSWFAINSFLLVRRNYSMRRQLLTTAEFLNRASPSNIPIVMGNYPDFHALAFYASPPLRSRLVYATSPLFSRQYIGHDTIDRQLPQLFQWTDVNVIAYDNFVAAQSEFFIYGYIPGWTWVTHAVVDASIRTDLVALNGNQWLLRATQSGSQHSKSDLTTSGSLPQERFRMTNSLCALWMKDFLCRTLAK